MAAENCSVLDPWTYHYPHEPWGLIDDHIDHENELFTRALQFSLYNHSMASPAAALTPPESSSLSLTSRDASGSSSFGLLLNQLTATEAMAMGGPRRGGPLAATGRVAKRRARPSKRRPTTYINADMDNFREMVQRVTGVRVGAGDEPRTAAQLEPAAKTGAELSETAVRGRIGLLPDLQHVRLPTLDTSELFLDRNGTSPAGDGSIGCDFADTPPSGFDLDLDMDSSLLPVDFPFPTLDSWL